MVCDQSEMTTREVVFQVLNGPFYVQGFLFYCHIKSFCRSQFSTQIQDKVLLSSEVWESTVPRPVSEASECTVKGWLKSGFISVGELALASISRMPALLQWTTQSGCPVFVRSEKGETKQETLGTNLL